MKSVLLCRVGGRTENRPVVRRAGGWDSQEGGEMGSDETKHAETLADCVKLLTLLGSPCPKTAGGHDHEWHECPRCSMLHELEMRDSLARRLLLASAAALAREQRLVAALRAVLELAAWKLDHDIWETDEQVQDMFVNAQAALTDSPEWR